MKTTTPCPACETEITIKDFRKFTSPFTMRCPYCDAKLKETKMTPILLLLVILLIPVFIYISVTIKNYLVSYFAFIEDVPTGLIFIVFCYPIYYVYEAFNAFIIMNNGNLQLKKQKNKNI